MGKIRDYIKDNPEVVAIPAAGVAAVGSLFGASHVLLDRVPTELTPVEVSEDAHNIPGVNFTGKADQTIDVSKTSDEGVVVLDEGITRVDINCSQGDDGVTVTRTFSGAHGQVSVGEQVGDFGSTSGDVRVQRPNGEHLRLEFECPSGKHAVGDYTVYLGVEH